MFLNFSDFGALHVDRKSLERSIYETEMKFNEILSHFDLKAFRPKLGHV